MSPKSKQSSSLKRVILGVTGSIAAYKAGDIIRRLQDKGCNVTVIMTKEAQQFITPMTLGNLSGNKVYGDMFASDGANWEMSHINLARDANVLLIAPATANIIGKLACGLSDDLLSCTAMSTSAPIIIAPAMNVKMYKNKIVQENCDKLKKTGIKFVDPVKGSLACGVTGEGHLAEIEDIVKAAVRFAK